MPKTQVKKNISEIYEKVKQLVSEGYTIARALEQLKIRSTPFYMSLTNEQKKELKVMKMSMTKSGGGDARINYNKIFEDEV